MGLTTLVGVVATSVAAQVDSALSGLTVAEVRFRQEYGVTLVGIRRGEEHVTTVTSAETLLADDCLIVIGATAAVEKLKNEEPV